MTVLGYLLLGPSKCLINNFVNMIHALTTLDQFLFILWDSVSVTMKECFDTLTLLGQDSEGSDHGLGPKEKS